jgi:hypothetical protein
MNVVLDNNLRACIIAYSKSIALLYDQTKLMLNEPFYTQEECSTLRWPSDTKSLDGEEIWDNKDIRSILRKYKKPYRIDSID